MSALDVFVGTTRVGLLERLDEWEHRFSFDAAWLADPARPVLGQIFEERKPRGLASTGHVPGWFDHLLPPKGGPLRRAIARQIAIEPDDDFGLLQFLGEDLPGAVLLLPGEPSLAPAPGSDRTPEPAAFAREGKLRFSLAGMQWKLSVREQDRKLTLPVRGETGAFIAKFPSPMYKSLPRIELSTMRWAKLSGIEVPPIRLANISEFVDLPQEIPTDEETVFLIERFDRSPAGDRVHIEDFGQVLDCPADDRIYGSRYEHIAAFLSYLPPEELRAFCERLVFCVLSGNTDAHLKNWSLIYPDGRHPRLSPAYDLVSSMLYEPERTYDLGLSLNGSRRFQDVSVESFRPLAKITHRAFDEVATWVRDMTDRVLTVWREHAADLPYLLDERARLEVHIARVPLTAGQYYSSRSASCP